MVLAEPSLLDASSGCWHWLNSSFPCLCFPSFLSLPFSTKHISAITHREKRTHTCTTTSVNTEGSFSEE